MVSTSKAEEITVVDAEGCVAGRLSSIVSKLLLAGSMVVIINAEKALISGSKNNVLNEWLKRLEIGSVINPKHGPFHPRTPDRILTRIIRGMVPRRRPRGVEALKRLRVYVGAPKRYTSARKAEIHEAKATRQASYYVTLGEIAKRIGWRSLPG